MLSNTSTCTWFNQFIHLNWSSLSLFALNWNTQTLMEKWFIIYKKKGRTWHLAWKNFKCAKRKTTACTNKYVNVQIKKTILKTQITDGQLDPPAAASCSQLPVETGRRESQTDWSSGFREYFRKPQFQFLPAPKQTNKQKNQWWPLNFSKSTHFLYLRILGD